jgi:hypothetical protein
LATRETISKRETRGGMRATFPAKCEGLSPDPSLFTDLTVEAHGRINRRENAAMFRLCPFFAFSTAVHCFLPSGTYVAGWRSR